MNNRAIQNIKLLPHQYYALTANDKFVDLIGGIGSGKSFAGACHVVNMTIVNPKSTGFIGANSYKQLTDATLSTTFSLLDSLKIPFTFKQGKGHLYIGTKLFLCRTMENYDDFRGFEISDYWVDEIGFAKHQAVKVLRGRMRHKDTRVFRGLGTTSPCGFNWLYDESIIKPLKNKKLVRAKTRDNKHLPDGYEQDLRETYDARMVAQELDGDFVNLNALPTYYAWDRTTNIDNTLLFDPNLPVYVGMDFNVNPMTAAIFQVTDEEILYLDEIFLTDGAHANTYGMCQALKEKGYDGVGVIPDATGKALKSSAVHGHSDHVILREAGFRVMTNPSNPHIADRYLCMNGLMSKKLENGKARLRVHPRCVKLIRDFEQMSRNDEHEDDISHISDAAGYGAWKFFPLRAPREAIKQYSY